jgi:hypothetical protein
MFNFQNPVQSQPFAVPARLNRLLLFCRFDFRQKSWRFPAWEICRDRDSKISADAAALASAVFKTISDFSDPSLGGAKPPKTETRRIGIRYSNHPSLGKPNNQQKRKNEN